MTLRLLARNANKEQTKTVHHGQVKDTALFTVQLDLSQVRPQRMDGQLHIALEINEYLNPLYQIQIIYCPQNNTLKMEIFLSAHMLINKTQSYTSCNVI